MAAIIFTMIAFSNNDKKQRTATTLNSNQRTEGDCRINVKSCSSVKLCNFATIGSVSELKWDTNFLEHVREAKARGLRCGVNIAASADSIKSKIGNATVSLSTGKWKQVKGKCLKENLVSNSPFSKISLYFDTSDELQLALAPRNAWQEKTNGQIRFRADFGEAFFEPYAYYATYNHARINMSAFEALFKRANWVDMTFPSGKTYRLSLSGSAAVLNYLRQNGCG